MYNLFDMIDNIENGNSTLENELQKQEENIKNIEEESENLLTIEPKSWFKFDSFEDIKEKLKNYKSLIRKRNIKYINYSTNREYICEIVGYVDYPKNVDYDVLVIKILDKYHAIRTDYLLSMQ